MISKNKITLIDVRSDEEVDFGKIKTSKHIPIEELSNAFLMNLTDFKYNFGFDKFNQTDYIVFYCRTNNSN